MQIHNTTLYPCVTVRAVQSIQPIPSNPIHKNPIQHSIQHPGAAQHNVLYYSPMRCIPTPSASLDYIAFSYPLEDAHLHTYRRRHCLYTGLFGAAVAAVVVAVVAAAVHTRLCRTIPWFCGCTVSAAAVGDVFFSIEPSLLPAINDPGSESTNQ